MALLGAATLNTNDEVSPIFVADEMALPTDDGGRILCDLFAVRPVGDHVFRPMIIELKSARQMKRLVEQVESYSSFVEEHLSAFESLTRALLERDVHFEPECERWIVWPTARPGEPDPREAALGENDIRVLTYEQSGTDFVLRAGQAPGVVDGC